MATHMTHSGQKKAYDATALAVIAVLFIALIVVVTFLFRGARIDLTQNKLYTIAQGTKNVLTALDEPINLYFFFSQEASRDEPGLRAYAQHVREMLEEMAQRSNGKLHLSVIDPQPFSDDEDRATQFGLEAVPIGSRGEQLYFGLAGTNSTDGKQTIPFFQPEPDKQQFLEYDVASLIYRLAHPKRPTIGLLSSLPMDQSFDQQTGRMRESWGMLTQMRELYTVRSLAPDLKSVDKDIDLLMVVHPKNLAPATLYAIDQFVMRGGKLLAFVDPRCEVDPAANPMGNPMMAAAGGGVTSNLDSLFKAWGIEYDPSKAIGDQGSALSLPMRQGQAPVRFLVVLGLTRPNMNANDVVSAKLDSIYLWSAGALKQAKDAKTQFEPLLSSSNKAALIDTAKLAFISDPQVLQEGFAPTGENYTIAARVHGKLASAFPNGQPDNTPDPEHLKEASGEANVVVVADTDMLADRMWLRVQNVLGQRYMVAATNNYDFVANVLDNLTGSSDLISVRGRQSFARPFTRVDDLRQRTDQQLRAKEQELNRQLQDTERKLTQLQSSRTDQGALTLSKEQEQELQRFLQERGRVRKELRDVRRGLDVGIESLGLTLKVINITAIPLVLIVFALVVAFRRRQRLRISRSVPPTGGVA